MTGRAARRRDRDRRAAQGICRAARAACSRSTISICASRRASSSASSARRAAGNRRCCASSPASTPRPAARIKVEAPGWAVQNAMVFQESGLFPWMSVETNVGFGLMTRGVPPAEAAERVEAALKLVGLTKFRRHYPHQLSGGMRQRERDRARLRHRSRRAADGRAVRRARRAEPRDPAGRAGADLGADPQDRGLHHPFDRGGACCSATAPW